MPRNLRKQVPRGPSFACATLAMTSSDWVFHQGGDWDSCGLLHEGSVINSGQGLGPFLILHLALFLGLAHSWVRMPLDIIALGFWSCALVAYGHLALVHRLYIAEWRGIPNPPWREPSVAPASVCLPSLALILKIGVTL